MFDDENWKEPLSLTERGAFRIILQSEEVMNYKLSPLDFFTL